MYSDDVQLYIAMVESSSSWPTIEIRNNVLKVFSTLISLKTYLLKVSHTLHDVAVYSLYKIDNICTAPQEGQ